MLAPSTLRLSRLSSASVDSWSIKTWIRQWGQRNVIRCDSNQVGSLTAGTRCEEPLLSLHGVDRGRGTSDDEDLVYFCMRRAGNTTSDFLATLYCLGLGSMDLKIDSKKGTVPVLDPRLGVLVHSEFSEMLVSYT